MKKIISIVMLMICIINMILPVSVVNAEENTEYECIQLPIISDKSKEAVTNITLYKDNDTLYAPLHTVCPLINAEWYMKDGGFYISRDNCMYFRYYHDGNMKLIIDLDIGDDKWNKSDNVLLEGNIFSCKKIGVEWCVDFIKFCDMFGVTFRQVSPSSIQSAKDNIKKNIEDSAFEKLNSIDIENDLDFNNNPYYIYLYTGTPLISLYAQVMRDKNLYIWDYSCYENLNLSEEDNAWIEEILKSIQYSDITQYLTIQSQNCLSNVVNDNWGITKLITAPPYDSSEHYKKALVNISSINYGENLKLEDIESINQNNKAQELERLLNSNTILSSSDSTITILNKYLNDQIKIPELKAFTKISDVINWIGTPFQTYFEVENFHNKLNSINEDKVQLLTKSIIENDSINNVAEKQKIGNDILSYLNKTASTNIFLNSIDNYAGLMDSSKEICSLYKNSDKQFKEKLSQSTESELYALGDSAISKMLEKSGNPYLVLTGAVIGVYDGFTAWTKENFGEQLQNSEILVQAYFIERIMKESLDIKNTENLYNRLTLMLQSSLCCFEYDENYFQTNRNKISKMLYMLDNDKNININYYHDPKNDNVDENVINAIKNYSDNKIESNDNYTWHLDPTIEAEDIILSDKEEIQEGNLQNYKYASSEYSIIKNNSKYGIIKYDGTLLTNIRYDSFSMPNNKEMWIVNENSHENPDDVIITPNENSPNVDVNLATSVGFMDYYYTYSKDKNELFIDGHDFESYFNTDYNVVVEQSEKEYINSQNKNALYGIADKDGIIIPCEYENACMNIGNNIIALEKNDKWGFFDKNGTKIIDFICEPFESKVLDDSWRKASWDNGEIYPYLATNGYIPVKINGKCGYYDTQGNEVIPCGTFEEVRPVHNGLAWVKKDGKWGVIKLKEIKTETNLNNNTSFKGEPWQQLYANELKKYMASDMYNDKSMFDLYDIDDDGIPELFISDSDLYHFAECKVYSVNNGIINDLISFHGTVNFLKNEKLLYDACNQGHSYINLYKKEKNKVELIFSAYTAKDGQFVGEFLGEEDAEYVVNGKTTNKMEYESELSKYCDLSNSDNIEWGLGRKYKLNEATVNSILFNIETSKTTLFTGTVNTEKDPLNVRKSPSANAEIIGQIEKGSTVTVYSESGDWYEIEYNGGAGYVSKKYIKSNDSNSDMQTSNISDNQILKAVNKYLNENQSNLGVWLSDSEPYCPSEYMVSNSTNWSCPINLNWESYSPNEMAGAYPHFAYVDKITLKCTLTANYETVVEFDLTNYLN